MSPLFETIKVVNNTLLNLDYHNARVNLSRKQLLQTTGNWNLGTLIHLPDLNPLQTYKCRFMYAEKIIAVEFHPYHIKPLKTLKVVESPNLDYNYKYADRKQFEDLKLLHQQTDDIIITRNKRITDCTYANIIFWDNNTWVTPSIPLLKGTKRQKYIDEKLIVEQEITVTDFKLFTKAKIINAMIDMEESPDISINNIFY